MSVGMVILGFILGIVILLILVTLHEFAHFIAAKLSHAYVYEFSIGFGPRLISWRRKETVYSIRLIPFGGYVYIASEMVDPPKGRENEEVATERYMENIVRWKRLIFIASGAVFNFFIAAFIFTVMFASTGYKANDMTYWGANYNLNQAAYNSMDKIIPNDKVGQNYVVMSYFLYKDKNDSNTNEISILSDKTVIPNYTQTVYNFIDHLKDINADTGQVKINFTRVDKYRHIDKNQDGSIKIYTGNRVSVTKNNANKSSVGIAAPTRFFTSTAQAYGYGWTETFEESKTILKSFGLLFTGQWSQLSGPVGIAKTMSNVVETGAAPFFMYVAMLSANLFVLNLIPIPPLDGYKFVETFVEMCIRRELSRKWKLIVNIAGALVFIALFVGITIKDIFF